VEHTDSTADARFFCRDSNAPRLETVGALSDSHVRDRAPWYGIAYCLIDRDGGVIGCNLPIGNGPLLEQAPAMAALLRELVAGVPASHLRDRAARLLNRIDTGRGREPGDDDE
jgi:hypothetical protein